MSSGEDDALLSGPDGTGDLDAPTAGKSADIRLRQIRSKIVALVMWDCLTSLVFFLWAGYNMVFKGQSFDGGVVIFPCTFAVAVFCLVAARTGSASTAARGRRSVIVGHTVSVLAFGVGLVAGNPTSHMGPEGYRVFCAAVAAHWAATGVVFARALGELGDALTVA